MSGGVVTLLGSRKPQVYYTYAVGPPTSFQLAYLTIQLIYLFIYNKIKIEFVTSLLRSIIYQLIRLCPYIHTHTLH